MTTYETLEKQDITKSGRLFRIFLAPIWFLMEYFCFKKYWKIILSEFIENQKLFEFLDQNEFALKDNRFVKMDLIDSNEYLQGRTLQDCKHIIKKEFVEELPRLIESNCSINIESLLTLVVNTDFMVTYAEDGTSYRNAFYEVYIQYCRLWWVQKAKKYMFVWLSVISVITFVLIFILNRVL